MTWWSDTDQRWHWRATDHAGDTHAGTAGTRKAAELDARVAGQRRRAAEPSQLRDDWRTKRWSQREGRWIPNVRPHFPRLPTPPAE